MDDVATSSGKASERETIRMRKILNLLSHHGVKFIMLGLTTAFFIGARIVGNICPSSWFIAILILFQIRGIIWEDTYKKALEKMHDKLELWKNKQ